MGFAEDIARLAEQIVARKPHLRGEEATKHALVVPFLQVLGYDVFDPLEVQPEYIADFAKKSRAGQLEKVDYAIRRDGTPVIFIECKPVDAVLEDHEDQLQRYFSATPSVRIALLTNGQRVKAFTDLQQPNIMDPTPFLDVDLTALKPAEIDALRMFHKVDFSPERVMALAEEMVYYNALTKFISTQLRDPSEAFVRFVVGEIQSFGRVTQRVVERISPILRKAIQTAIVEHVARSFDSAQPPTVVVNAVDPPSEQPDPSGRTPNEVTTTEAELRCFTMIESWLRESRPSSTVQGRDSMTYYAIHQNNVRKWFIRFNVQKVPFWIAFRHVKPEEVRAMAPASNVADGGGFGDSKVHLVCVDDVQHLREVVVASHDREASRKTEETPEN